MAGEKALRRWFEEKRAALTAQVSSFEAQRNRILHELEDIDSLLERERFRLEIVDEFAAEVGAIISDRVSPDMEMPPRLTDAVTTSVESEPSTKKRELSAAVGRVMKGKKLQEIVEQVEDEEGGST